MSTTIIEAKANLDNALNAEGRQIPLSSVQITDYDQSANGRQNHGG